MSTPDILVVMNNPSFDKFEPKVAEGGTMFCDSTMVDRKSSRTDIKAVYIPATELANDNGLTGFANMIILGTLIRETGLFTYDEFNEFLISGIPAAKSALIEKNEKALELGYNYR